MNDEIECYEKEKDRDTESGKYGEPIGYNASQESVDFWQKTKEVHGDTAEDTDADKEEELRRSLRYKGKEDKKVEDLAKSRVEARDNYGNNTDPSTSENDSLMHMTSLIGIDPGCSIEMIDKNIAMIQKMEKVRK